MRDKVCATYNHFTQFINSDARIMVNQGGARSGKTYSILERIIELNQRARYYKFAPFTTTIARKTFPALRGSAMRDFFDLLQMGGMYNEKSHDKSHSEYRLYGGLIEFISVDQPGKIRGRKRDLLFVNEANELTLEDWRQLLMRTTGRIIIDYNPADEYHWIYDHVLPRADTLFFQTTYKDNPFLSPELVSEIELLKDTDEDYWLVYGLGERGRSRALIFQHQTTDEIPKTARHLGYGLDWGFTNAPTTLVHVFIDGRNLYMKELLYRTGMTNYDVHLLLTDLGISRHDVIYADSEDPKSITELQRYGWNVQAVVKGQDSVNAGIDVMKRYRLFATSDSLNLIKELRNYKWKLDPDGRPLNEPVKLFDHLIDASRYCIYMCLSNPSYGQYAIR